MNPLTDPSKIDLTKHGVIEASAGTGKTYTIENLVVRLLVEEQVTLDKILLVTFTEKATGEMGQRIRANIEKALLEGDYNEEKKNILQNSLDHFDESSIQTIHGFCQRMLRLYALENGMPYETEVVEDGPLYESRLHDLMRRGWREKYGASYESILRMSGFEGTVIDRRSWKTNLLEIGKAYHPSIGHRLHPEPPEDMDRFISEFRSSFESLVEKAIEVVGGVVESIEDNPFYNSYGNLNFNTRSRSTCLTKVVGPILRFLAGYEKGKTGWGDFQRVIEEARKYKRFEEEGASFDVLIPKKWNKGADNREDVCPQLDLLVDLLEKIRKLEPGKRVFAGLIEDLIQEVDRYKSDRGMISFDDMILRFHAALQPENPAAERFLKELRGRYAYALVDEFQDTDPAQWGIFQRIFLESPGTNRLFIIGDPKQAIYRFRGADVNTYLRAKEEILNHPEGEGYSLAINWRSTPEMIGVFNRLFAGESGWFRKESGIEHGDVSPPPQEKQSSFLLEDSGGTHPLTLVAMPEGAGMRVCKFAYYQWVADEIARLSRDRERILIQTRAGERPLQLDDICVLVRTKNEAEEFQEVLGERVPSTIYKKSGLYDSAEAFHLSCLLHALADPDSNHRRAALLTDFFSVTPETLRDIVRTDSPLPYQDLFSKWLESAADRNWPVLFHSLLTESHLFFGRDEEGNIHPQNERSWTNYQHLVQNLETEAALHGWDIVDMAITLDRYRNRTVDVSVETELQRLESETPKVRIMTLHVAKGLEFPVVFVVGGVTSGHHSTAYLKVQDPQTKRVIFDLTKDPGFKNLFETEEEDEISRLYYVGLTRAQHKLYLPILGEGKRLGKPGPLSKKIGPVIEEAIARTGDRDVAIIPYKEQTLEEHAEEGVESAEMEIDLPDPLFPSIDRDYSERKIESFSFTSLAHSRKWKPEAIQYGEGRERDLDEEADGEGGVEIEAIQPILPPGERTGSMMHEILERVSFKDVLDSESPDRLFESKEGLREIAEGLNKVFLGTPREDRFEEYVRESLRWVWNVLHLPLPVGEGFRLGQLTPWDRQHEMEFYYPIPKSSKLKLTSEELSSLAIGREVDGFLNGFIDLVFRVEGKYYLLDWKTNSLPDYSPETVQRSMEENQYTLQYEIYSIALHHLLRMSLADYDPSTHFGGVFYLYLRGIDPAREDRGVYWRSSKDMKPIDRVEREIFERIHGVEKVLEVAR